MNKETAMETKADAPYFLSKRWILAYLCFYGYFCQYIHRTNINIAIVCMVRTKMALDESNNATILKYTNATYGNTTIVMATEPTDESSCSGFLEDQKLNSEMAEFDWGKTQVSAMLSSYYYGVVVTQVFAGWAAIRFGGKLIITISMIVQGTCSLLIPTLTRLSFYCLFVIRVIMGLFGGFVSPAIFTIWTKWAPPNERGRLLNVSLLGGIVGTVMSFSTSGLLCVHGFDRGWGSIFYIHGILTALYILVWLVFVSDTPNDHPSITEAEKEYLNEVTGATANRKEAAVPWKKIMTSPAVLVLTFTHTCFNWSNYTLLTTLPLYMKEVLKFDIQQNGLLTSVPHVCMAVIMIFVGVLSDVVTRDGCLSITCARRVFQGISFFGISSCLFLITFVTCDHKAIAVVILCVGTMLLGFCQGGYYLNAMDFAPKYSGVIYGLSNSISCITGTVAPLVAGLLTTHGTQEEWNNVFYVCIGISVAGALVFCTLSRGDVQDWAKDDETTEMYVDPPASPKPGLASDSRLNHLMVSTEWMGSLHSLHSTHSMHNTR